MEKERIRQMRKDADAIFMKGLKAVDPSRAIKKNCRFEKNRLIIGNRSYNTDAYENIYIVGAGKATASMASAIIDILGNRISGGTIIVKYDHLPEQTSNLQAIDVVEAGHPIPDENGRSGAERIYNLALEAKDNELILCLISGGGSALMPLPAHGLTLEDKQATGQILLDCGASIHEINAIRKHLSAIKGGRLARAAYPARLITLILSDVVGDDPDVIASGPTVPDSGTFADCRNILDKYNITQKIPQSVRDHIEKGLNGQVPETPKENEKNNIFELTYNYIIGNNTQAISEAGREANARGYHTLILSTMVTGETRHVAAVHTAIAKEILKSRNPIPPPACILSGGETTVTVKGNGLGGRNQEFALAAALEVADAGNIVVLSAGTDGTDGPTDAAGAFADALTVKRALKADLNPKRFLAENDSYRFFSRLGDLYITGPTNTNVMDLHILLID